MSAVLEVIADAFVFLAKRVADLIAISFLIASFPGVWRWPWVAKHMKFEKEEWRLIAIGNFFIMIGDIITVAIFIATMCTWRVIFLCFNAFKSGNGFYDGDWHLAVWYSFGSMLLDIPTGIAFILAHLPFWRIPNLYNKLSAESEWPIFHCGSSSRDTECRKIIFKHLTETKMLQTLFNAFVDFICGILGFFVIVTGFRTKVYLEETGKVIASDPPMDSYDQKKITDEDEIAYEKRYMKRVEWRKATLEHFVLAFRDVVIMLPLFCIVLASLYRGFLAIATIITKLAPWADFGSPKLKVSSMKFEKPPNDRPKGIVWKITANIQDPTFTLKEGESVNLYVRSDDEFWDYDIKRNFGGSAATFGQMLLPMRLDKEYLDCSVLRSAHQTGTQIELVMDFDVKFGLKTILESTDKFKKETEVHLQLEIGSSHEATLLVCAFKIHDLRKSVEENHVFIGADSDTSFATVATAERAAGARFCDIFWQITVFQFMFLMRDLLTVIGFLLLHLFPHRIYKVYTQMCQGPARQSALENEDAIETLLTDMKNIHPITAAIDLHISEIDSYIRAVINATPSRDPDVHYNRSYYNDSFSDTDDDDGVTHHSRLKKNMHGQKRSNSSWYWWDYERYSTKALEPSWTLKKFMEKLDKTMTSFSSKKASASCSRSATAVTDALGKLEKKIAACCEAVRLSFLMKHVGGITVPRFYTPGAIWASKVATAADRRHQKNKKKKKNNGWGNNNEDEDEGMFYTPSPNFNKDQQQLNNSILGKEAPLYQLSFDPDVTPMEQFIHNQSVTIQQQIEIDLSEALKFAKEETTAQACCDSSKADGWDGVVAVVAREIANLFLDIGSVICFILVCCTIYRLPWMCREVYNSYKKRMTCILALREIALDVGYLLMFIFVLASVRGTLKVLADMLTFMPRYPSFQVGRAIISYHFTLVMNVLWIFASIFFSCRAIKFTLATTAFAALSPGVMLESALLRLSNEGKGAGKCAAAVLLIIACFWMFGVPFLSANQGDSAYTATPAIIYFSVLAFFVVLAIVTSYFHADSQIFLLRRPTVRFARPTLSNALAFVYLLFEAAQLLALSFSAAYAAGYLQDENVLYFFQGVFFLFGQSWTSDNLAFGAYLCIVIMAVHFLVVAMPVVTGYLLDWTDSADINKHPVWIGALTLLGFLLQMTVSRNVAELVSCSNGTSTYNKLNGFEPELTYVFNASGNGETTVEGPICWEGPHRALAVAAMILGVFYLPTTLSRNAFFDESFFTDIDVVYTQYYRMLTGACTVTATVIVALFTPFPDKSQDALIIVLVMSLLCFIVSVAYPYLAKKAEGASQDTPEQFVTFPALRNCRFAVYLGSVIAAIVCLVTINNNEGDRTSLTPVWISIGVMFGLYSAALIYSVISVACWHFPEDDSFDALRDELLKFEADLNSKEKMTLRWSGAADAAGTNCLTGSTPRESWQAAVKSSMRVSALALQVVKLEENMSLLKVSPMFLRNKPKWNKDLRRLVDDVDLEDDIERILQNLNRRDSRYCFGDCEADCDWCCDDGYGSRRWSRRHSSMDAKKLLDKSYRNTIAKKIRRLENAIQSLINAARHESEVAFDLPTAPANNKKNSNNNAHGQPHNEDDDDGDVDGDSADEDDDENNNNNTALEGARRTDANPLQTSNMINAISANNNNAPDQFRPQFSDQAGLASLPGYFQSEDSDIQKAIALSLADQNNKNDATAATPEQRQESDETLRDL